ncbi:MAG: hypothetical protein ACM3N5_10510 [Candidatus Eiseniibacteriota bacterium]
MISLREVVASLYGAWRLVRLDRSAIGYFDATVQGLWRSFFAAVLALPLDFSIMMLARSEPLPDDVLHYGLAYLIFYALSWLVWPLLALYLARALDRADALPLYVTAHNWAQLPINVFQLALLILAGGFFPEDMLLMARLSLIVILFYEGYIAYVALRIDRAVAAGVAGAYFSVAYLIGLIGVFVMH